jgi:hypothetical protein
MNKWLVVYVLVMLGLVASAQHKVRNDSTLIQVSGLVLTGDSLRAVPFAAVAVRGTHRGVTANYKGFFSLVVRRGEVLEFSSVGFKDKSYMVPDTIRGNRFSLVQLLTADEYILPETVIFPWPDRDHFKVEFLAMDVTNELEERAMENLSAELLARVQENTLADGAENYDYYNKSVSQKMYYIGQTPPMNIFNVFAWAQFIKDWKAGKFKRKKPKETN